MKCIDDELLQGFFDGECSDEEATRARLHLGACQHCRHRHAQLQTRVHAVHQALGMLCSDNIAIPPIPLSVPARKRFSLHPKHILPLLAAASIAIFLLIFHPKEQHNMYGDPMLQSYYPSELDANKPVDQQELRFTAISPDGKVSEDVVR